MNKIWTSRLIFKANLIYGKPYNSLSESEQKELNIKIVAEDEDRKEKSRRFNNY
tara:strand:- start:16489 stop:16650 length:162 start_codon:yes stop_codon:yes gene_type:complete